MSRRAKPDSKLADAVVPYANGQGPASPDQQAFATLRPVSWEEYEEYLQRERTVPVEGKRIALEGYRRVTSIGPSEFQEEKTTVWSFPDRGKWATHKADYRGNWSPWVVRNILHRYSKPGDLVLDQMVGGGTTLVECRIMGRRGIGVDINLPSIMLTMDRLNFDFNPLLVQNEVLPLSDIALFHGDARRLDAIDDDSIDLIATHPPYANIIPYSHDIPTPGDLSRVHSLNEFFDGIAAVAAESLRVLKPGGYAAILIGDTHKHAHYVPISYRVMELFLAAGFVLKEDIIKLQWHTQTERGRWHPRFATNFLMTAHEHLFVFRKLRPDEKVSKFKASAYLPKEDARPACATFAGG